MTEQHGEQLSERLGWWWRKGRWGCLEKFFVFKDEKVKSSYWEQHVLKEDTTETRTSPSRKLEPPSGSQQLPCDPCRQYPQPTSRAQRHWKICFHSPVIKMMLCLQHRILRMSPSKGVHSPKHSPEIYAWHVDASQIFVEWGKLRIHSYNCSKIKLH